jgi:L-erythro-3,5-diaminohexanoate dehydrogenase
MTEALGTGRVLAPGGVLPQAAERLDPSPPVRPLELQIDVEILNVDAAGYRHLLAATGGPPRRLEAAVVEIVRLRGKLENPVTGSGGMLIGTVSAVGDVFPDPPELGTRIATLASLTLTPLALDELGPATPDSPQIRARGRAYLPATAPWTPVPDDLPIETVLAVLDTYGAASHVRALAEPGDAVLVLGAGNAGMLACAAAVEAVGPDGRVCAIDSVKDALDRALALGVAQVAARADLTQPLDALAAAAAAGIPPADLSVVVVSSPGCEQAAILLTKPHGTIVFFSMATSFTAAALAAEGIGSSARMLIGSGYAADRGDYALDLVRRHAGLVDS